MTTVFLSHSVAKPDEPLLKEIEESCAARGIQVYLAEREFAPTTVASKLRVAIASSDFVVVLITESGASSTWVSAELAIANEMTKPIIPLVEQGVQPPGILEGRDQIRFQRTNLKEAVDRATRFIAEHESVETPRNPPVDDFATGMLIGVAITVVVLLILLALTSD